MKTRTPNSKDTARTSEQQLSENDPDSFPPEGTDERTIRHTGNRPLSEKDRLKATKGFMKMRDDATHNPA